MNPFARGPFSASKTQQRLRRRVEARLGTLGKLADYRRDRFWERLRKFFERVAIGLFVLVGIVGVPLVVVLVFANGLLFNNAIAINSGNAALMLSLHSALYVSLVILIATRPKYGIYSPMETVVLSFFPLTDRQLLLRGIRQGMTVMLCCVLPVAALYGVLAFAQGYSLAGWLAVISLAFLHSMTFAAVGMLGMALMPSTALVFRVAVGVGIILLIMIINAAVMGSMNNIRLDEMPASFAMFPPGWVDAIVYHGVVMQRPQAFLLIIPCAFSMAACGFWIRRADINKQPLLDAVMEGADTPSQLSTVLTKFMTKPETAEFKKPPAEVEPQDLLESVRIGLDTDRAWRQSGWIARWMGWMLGPSDRHVFTAWHYKMPNWSLRMTLVLLGFAGLLATNFLTGFRYANPSPIPFVVLAICCASLGSPQSVKLMYPRNGLHAHFPIAVLDLVRASFKVACSWAILLLPWLILSAIVKSIIASYPMTMTLYQHLMPLLLFIAYTSAAPCTAIAVGGNWRWQILLFVLWMAHLLIGLFAFGCALYSTSPLLNIVGFLVAGLVCCSIVWTTRKLLQSGKVDLLLDRAKRQGQAWSAYS